MNMLKDALVFLPLFLLCSASINSPSSKLGKFSGAGYKDYFDNSGACFHKGTCQPLQNATCFGTSLPYTHTSVDLAEDSRSLFEVQDNLALWQGLRSVPRCWAVIQPFLCAVYMPKCENDSISLPSQEMCRITRGPCKTVAVEQGWPTFLQCDNKKLFPSRCRNPLQEIKFNTSYKCISPLVETDNPDNWFHDVAGCGIQCRNPLYTEKDHIKTHHIICFIASLSFAITAFTVVTFVISWKKLNRYPEKIIFYVNLCWAIVSFGWIVQFFPGAREEIVCMDDGTVRRRQPESGQHLCSITFVLIYSFCMAAIVWFVILTYAWYSRFREKCSQKNYIQKKKAYFHMCAWCIPLVLTVITMAITEVDGDSMSGICFVGFSNINMRLIFVLVPVGVAALLGGYFLALFLFNVVKVMLNSEEVTSKQSRKKFHHMMFNRGFFALCLIILVCITFSCHAYDFINRKEWDESFKDYVVCLAMNSGLSSLSTGESSYSKCVLKSKPNVNVLHIHLCCLLIFGMMVSSLIWNKSTLETWKSFFYGLCAPAEKNANSLKKHQIIAKCFQKRHQFNEGNVSNISFTSAHEDPLGLNMDISSEASRDITSSWANALPNLLWRRNAITSIDPFLPRQYSSASDVSRYISMDSFNQPTLDSLSMQISERDYQQQAWRQRRKTRKERERFLRANRIAPWFPGNRRGSDTSLQSSLLAASMAAAAAKNPNVCVKVTKSTSTGDLGIQPSIIDQALVLPRPRHKSLMQQVSSNPPPFTHGMADSSNRLECRNTHSVVGQTFTPIPIASTLGTPLPSMLRPPIYPQGYDMNTLSAGFMGGILYPPMNGSFPRFPSNNNFGFPPFNMPFFPYAAYQSIDVMSNPYQPSLIPLHPRADSASETEFFPIIMSDSDFTDTGFRSYNESQVLTTQRLMQERLQAQLQAKSQQEHGQHAKPVLESQACAKTQFLKRLNSDAVATQTSRPPSGRKSHDTAPPPSPADSVDNVNSEIVNSEDVNSEIVNSEDVNSEIVNSEGVNSEIINSEEVNSETVNSEEINSEIMNSEEVNNDNISSTIVSDAIKR